MLHLTILILFFATSPLLVSSLECYSCRKPIVLNYTLTSDTVPSFFDYDCRLFNTTTCYIRVAWDRNTNNTLIEVDIASFSSATNMGDTPDFIATTVSMQVIHHQDHINFEHSILFFCTTMDRGNNQTTLQRILRSLTIEDRFSQEIYPLLKYISPFDAKSAECFEFQNDTLSCPNQDLNRCQRCYGTRDQYLSYAANVCQSCPRTQDFSNVAYHSSSFQLKSRQRTEDSIHLECQLNKCNSIDNLNRISNASKITFDFDTFFKH